MENANKVTIDAAWFAELYAKANGNQSNELRFDNQPQSLWVKIDELTKESDELKAKLEDARAHYCTNATSELGNACKVAALCRENEDKLAAAEQCIEEISKRTMFTTTNDNIVIGIIDIIRAYREKAAAR